MTLAYDYKGEIHGDIQSIPTYIVATATDTTATVTGPWIDNRDGRVRGLSFTCIGKDNTGSSPTLTTLLQGSNDEGTTAFSILDSAGNAITTSALSISSTDGTAANYALETENTNQEGINSFPPLFRLKVTVGGTGTPGWTGDIALTVDRSPLPAA